jgi:hypothetical protein
LPILSGVSGNALAFSLSLVYGLGVWNQPLVRGPATVDVAATEGALRLSREGGTCFGKTTACLTSELLLDASDAELADDAAGSVTYALLELRNLDRLGDAPGAVIGTIYDSHLEVDLDW